MSTLLPEPIFDAAAGAGGGASFTPPGGGGRIPPAPDLGLGRFVPSCPSFFYKKMNITNTLKSEAQFVLFQDIP